MKNFFRRFAGVMVIGLGTAALFAMLTFADDTPKIPESIQIRILKVQKDQLAQQNQLTQIIQAYNTTKAAIDHDDEELRTLRTEALTGAKLDPTKWDLNVEKLEFVQKPTVPQPPPKK